LGAPALLRARGLADAGWGPPAHGLHHGFLTMSVVCGEPLDRRAVGTEVLSMLAEYLAFVRRAFPEPGRIALGPLLHMVETNCREAFATASWLAGALGRVERARAAVEDAPATALDGRMLPHEWIHTATRYVKCDGVDHHDDHFW